MKNSFFRILLLSALTVSCSLEEIGYSDFDQYDGATFYATIDDQPDADTKVYADDQLRVLWNADDRITIFNKDTYNQQYRFTGDDGDNAGGFKKVPSDDEFVTSNPLDDIYAVYPYQENTKISNGGVISTSIPSAQTYKENSFGVGANVMVTKSETNMLKFKNVGGYLSLKFYGAGVSVSSISLKSNNGELIAGDCTVDMSSGSPVSNTSGKYDCVYRGIETPYGNTFQSISDVLFNRLGAGTSEDPYTYEIYFLPNATLYNAGAITDDYGKLNYNLSTADGYAKKFGVDGRYPFARLPVEVGASTATWYSDYYYYPRGVVCAARVGGGWGNGSHDGPSFWNCSYVPSYSTVGSRARLSKHR